MRFCTITVGEGGNGNRNGEGTEEKKSSQNLRTVATGHHRGEKHDWEPGKLPPEREGTDLEGRRRSTYLATQREKRGRRHATEDTRDRSKNKTLERRQDPGTVSGIYF